MSSGVVAWSEGVEARSEAWSEVRLEVWLDMAVVRVGRHGRLVVVRLRRGRMPCIDLCPMRQPLHTLRILVTND